GFPRRTQSLLLGGDHDARQLQLHRIRLPADPLAGSARVVAMVRRLPGKAVSGSQLSSGRRSAQCELLGCPLVSNVEEAIRRRSERCRPQAATESAEL